MEAVNEELQEEWMQQLATFVRDRLRPAANAREASSAAEVRDAFFQYVGGSVPKKEVGLRLARKGFAEETAHHYVGVRRTTKRVYRRVLTEGNAELVLLRTGAANGV
eukprot:14862492-Alexandrium_andersonii.AAC.1